jgi:hypothetical protein
MNLAVTLSNAVFQYNTGENELMDVLSKTPIQSGNELTQTQTDLITILTFYVNILNNLKSGQIKDEQSVQNRLSLQAHIKNNINLLVETMLTKPIPIGRLPNELKADIEKKYNMLNKKVESEKKTQQSLIKTLSNVKNEELNGKSATTNINLLAASIANELIYTDFYVFNILSMSQRVNEKLSSNVPFGVINAVKMATLKMLSPMLKERMTAMLENNIETLKTDLVQIKAKYAAVNDQLLRNNTRQLQKDKFQIALEIKVIQKEYEKLLKSKPALVAAIDAYVDIWITKQTYKIRGLGFSETLVGEKPDTVKARQGNNSNNIQTTCSAIEANVMQVHTANYFPLQFPNITK